MNDQESQKLNLIKLKKAAETYGFEYATIYQLVRANYKNILDCIFKIGGRFYIDKAKFEEWLRQQAARPRDFN